MMSIDAKAAAGYTAGMETMGDRIRTLRQARGLTQAQLAEICGVSAGAVSQWELGIVTDIRIEAFINLYKALNTDAEYLWYGPDREPDVGPHTSRRHP